MARDYNILIVTERLYITRYPPKFIMTRGHKTVIETVRLFMVRDRQSLLWPDATTFLKLQRNYFQPKAIIDHNGQKP